MSLLLKTQEITTVEWRVVDVFKDVEDENFRCFVSPTFNFADTTWRLLLAGKFVSCPEATSLIIMRNEHRSCLMEYTLSLKKPDGSVEQLDNGVMKEDEKRIEHKFIKLSEVFQYRDDLAPSNILTLACSLKLEHRVARECKRKRLRKLDTLSLNFKGLLSDDVNYDILICVKDREFHAHTPILVARSKFFAAMFQHDTREKETGIIRIPDCDPDAFQIFLEFLYCGIVEDLSFPNALHLYEISEKYGVLDLKAFCCENLTELLTVENWCYILLMADMYAEETLFRAAQKFFNQNLNSIFQTDDWDNLVKENYTLANKLLKEMPRVTLPESDE